MANGKPLPPTIRVSICYETGIKGKGDTSSVALCYIRTFYKRR